MFKEAGEKIIKLGIINVSKQAIWGGRGCPWLYTITQGSRERGIMEDREVGLQIQKTMLHNLWIVP